MSCNMARLPGSVTSTHLYFTALEDGRGVGTGPMSKTHNVGPVKGCMCRADPKTTCRTNHGPAAIVVGLVVPVVPFLQMGHVNLYLEPLGYGRGQRDTLVSYCARSSKMLRPAQTSNCPEGSLPGTKIPTIITRQVIIVVLAILWPCYVFFRATFFAQLYHSPDALAGPSAGNTGIKFFRRPLHWFSVIRLVSSTQQQRWTIHVDRPVRKEYVTLKSVGSLGTIMEGRAVSSK
jgi:hypothetical protein